MSPGGLQDNSSFPMAIWAVVAANILGGEGKPENYRKITKNIRNAVNQVLATSQKYGKDLQRESQYYSVKVVIMIIYCWDVSPEHAAVRGSSRAL